MLKRTLCIILIISIILSLGACGGAAPAATTAPIEATAEATKAPEATAEATKAPEATAEATAAEPAPVSSEPVEVNIWTWASKDEYSEIIKEFNKDYPNITIAFTAVDSAAIAEKLQAALASKSELPDISWIEAGQRGRILAIDCWEDLSAAPYNLNRDEILDFMLPLSTNARGELIGIDASVPMAGLAYKRDLAIKYLGTDDPLALSKMLPTWEEFIKVGQTVLEKSDNKVFMMPSAADAMNILTKQNGEPFIIENKLNLEASVARVLDIAIEMKQKGVVDSIEPWSPAWNASYSEKNHIFYACATWSPTWVIQPNDPDGSGNWGLMVPPDGGCTWGGTIHGIPRDAKDKMEAFIFEKWMYADEKGITLHRDLKQYLGTIKKYYENDFYSMKNPFFGGQDVGLFFAQTIMPNMAPQRILDKYDLEVNNAINTAGQTINAMEAKGSLTSKELIEKMTSDLKNIIDTLE